LVVGFCVFFFFFFFLFPSQRPKDLQCYENTNLCDEMNCGLTVFIGTANNSCFASATYASCGDLTWGNPKPNAQPCPVAIGSTPKNQCIEIAFESRFDEEVTLSSLGSLLTVKLRYLKPGEVAQFDKTGVWTQQMIDATGNLTFRLDFDGPDGTGQTALRWFARPCQPATSGPVATQPGESSQAGASAASTTASSTVSAGASTAPVATKDASSAAAASFSALAIAVAALAPLFRQQ
jgi:hypothetical protein